MKRGSELIDLPDRDAAKDRIESNQLGRRNLTPDQRAVAIGNIYGRRKNPVGKPPGTILGQNDPISTAEAVAKEHGVSAATVKRAAALPGVPDGWTADGWRRRLRTVAAACQEDHPERAAELRQEADRIGVTL